MPITFCLFFQAWGSLTSLKSQTRDPQSSRRIFMSWKKSIDLSRFWTREPCISKRARYPETTEVDYWQCNCWYRDVRSVFLSESNKQFSPCYSTPATGLQRLKHGTINTIFMTTPSYPQLGSYRCTFLFSGHIPGQPYRKIQCISFWCLKLKLEKLVPWANFNRRINVLVIHYYLVGSRGDGHHP